MTVSFTRGENPLRAEKLNEGLSERVNRAGDSMSGPLALYGNPATALEAATKQYVDTSVGSIVIPEVPTTADNGGAARNGKTGILIPYYVTPTNPRLGTASPIQRLLTMLRTYHEVPCIVVVNQAGNLGTGGPGPTADGNVAAIILQLKALGAIVLGYVDTGYGLLNENVIRADCLAWTTLYAAAPPDGIFFDQMAYDYGTADATLQLYQRLYSYCHDNLDYTMVVGNPGADEQQRWYDPPHTADVIACWENSVWPAESMWAPVFAGGHSDYDYRVNAVLVHSVATLDVAAFRTTQKYVKWIYATDDLLAPNPWDTLSVHTEALFALCASVVYAQLPPEVQQLPFGFVIPGKPTTGQIFNLSVPFPVTIPASLAGSTVYDTTLTTSNAAFSVNKITTGNVTTSLGTVTITSSNHFSCTLAGAGGSLAAGDVLQIQSLASDATLSDVGISILAARV